jgi:hypothetical protein
MPIDLFEQANISQEGPRDLFELNDVKLSDHEKVQKRKVPTYMGIPEAALSMMSALPSQIAGGLYGLGTLASGQGLDKAAEASKRVQEENFGMGTYKGTTDPGKRAVEASGEIMRKPVEYAGKGAEALGLDPIYGELPTEVALNFLPLHLGVVKPVRAINKAIDKAANKYNPPMSNIEAIVKEAKTQPDSVSQDYVPPTQSELLPSNAPQYGIDHSNNAGHWVTDENGMPISAERSMDVQAATHPLQRDLFSEEYLPAQGAERTLPEAVDKMVTDAPDLARDGMDNRSYEISRALFNDEVPGNLTETRQQIQKQFEGDDPIAQSAMAAAADMDTPSFSPEPIKGLSKSQRGALDPEVFKEGFRGLNRWLSRLTDQPWVRERFPASRYESNTDGSPTILLHGTREAFNDQPRAVGMEGLHAGYASAATLKSALRKRNKIDYRIGNLDFNIASAAMQGAEVGSAVYPIVIRKGNYPTLSKDYGSFAPYILANNQTFALDVARATNGKYSMYEVQDIMQEWARKSPGSDAFDNTRFAQMLKDQFDIDGFWYENKYETPKNKLYARSGEHQTPQRARTLAANQAYTKSFVTWDDNKIRSLYDEPVRATMSGGIGRSQAGALRVKDIEEGIKNLRNRFGTPKDSIETPVTPSMLAEKQDKVKKVKATSDILGTKMPEWTDPTTFEEAVSLIKNEKDIKSNPYSRGVAPGNNFMAAYHNNSLLKYARHLFNKARGDAAKFSKDYITAEGGLSPLITNMDATERVKIAELLTMMDKHQVDFTPEIGQQIGLSKNGVAFMEQLKKTSDAEWDWISQIRGEQGVKSAPKRKGYTASIWSGDYHSLVLDKNGDPIGFISASSPGEFALAVEYYKKSNPDAKFSAEKWQDARRSISGGNRKAIRYSDLSSMIKLLSNADGDFAKLQNKVQLDAVRAATELFGHDVHNMRKKGITGNLGNKPWLSPEKNARDRLDAIVRYFEEAAEHHALQKPAEELRLLTADESTQHMPNAKKYLDDYYRNVTGSYIHDGGRVMNAIFNASSAVVEGVSSRIPGVRNYVGPGNAIKLSNTVKNKMAQMYMGWFNWMFTASQLAQPVQTGVPMMTMLAQRVGLPPHAATKAMANSVPQFFKLSMNNMFKQNGVKFQFPVDAELQQVFQWARDRGILDFTELERAYEGHKTTVGRAYDHVAEWSMQMGENITRPPMFLAVVDMLKQVEPDLNKVLPVAENITNQIMADYHQWERPLMYSGLGVLAPHAGGLTTFKHNYAGTHVLLAKEAGKGNSIPLMLGALQMLMFAGITGTVFYDSIDYLYQQLREEVTDERRTIAQDFMKDVPEYMKTGVVSSLLGLNMQGKFSAADMVPDSFMKGAFPHLSGAYDIAESAVTAATNPNENSFANLAVDATPSGWKQATRMAVKRDEQGNLLNKQGQVDVPRTEQEWKKAATTGLVPLDEARKRNELYQNRQNERQRIDNLTELSKQWSDLIINKGTPEQQQELLTKYEKLGGDPTHLLKKIPQIHMEAAKTSKERAQGIPKSPQGVRRYEGYQQ